MMPHGSHLLLVAVLACGSHQAGIRARSDPDSLLAGTYRLQLTAEAAPDSARSIRGTLVLSDTGIPTRLTYLMDPSEPVRGCLLLRGDLGLLGPDIESSEPLAVLTGWRRGDDGWLTLPVYQGVDYGYQFTFVIRHGALEGVGRYHANDRSAFQYRATLYGARVGRADLRPCDPLLHQDSVMFAHLPH
jgi:hypothetical protein